MTRKRITFDIGHRSGSGVIISCLGARPDDKYRNHWWLLQCDCGNKYESRAGKLNKSCGCKRYAAGKEAHHWKGCGDIPMRFFTRCERGASKRDKEFSITIEDVSNQWEKQKGKCAYTGNELTFGDNLNQEHPDHKEITASLDRIDSSKGYTPENIEFCHKHINMMKKSFEKEHFIKMCKLVASVK